MNTYNSNYDKKGGSFYVPRFLGNVVKQKKTNYADLISNAK
jgi:hypothetical protein